MLQFITSGNDEEDMEHIEMLADGILERIQHIYKGHQSTIEAQQKDIKNKIKKAKGKTKEDLEQRKEALKDLIQSR